MRVEYVTVSVSTPPIGDVADAAAEVEQVVARAADELVGGVVAGQRVVAGAAHQALDVGPHVVGLGGLAVVGGAVEVDGDAGDAGRE